MKKFRKIAAGAAALICAAAMTVSAGATLKTVEESGLTKSSDGMFLVMLYSDGTYDATEKDKVDYGIDCTKIATADIVVNVKNSSNSFGGAVIMSSKSKDDASSHNWNSQEFYGMNDSKLNYKAASGKPVAFDRIDDGKYQATVKFEDKFAVIDNYNFVQFAIQDWSKEDAEIVSIVMKDADGNILISFNSTGKATVGGIEEVAEETTAAEEEVVEETNAAADTEEETTEAPAEEEAEEEWVSTFDASSVKIADNQAPYYDGLQFALRADNEAQASLESDFGFDITSVYGIRVNVEVDPADVEHGVWYGGSVGANCPSRGWGQHNFANGDGDELTFVESDGSITWQLDEPIFSEDDGYAFAFFQSWGGPIGVKSFELLDKDGNVIDYEAAAVEATVDAVVDAVDEAADEAVNEAVNEAVEDANKANPNTGVADVAVVAGLAVAAAGAAVITKKRK